MKFIILSTIAALASSTAILEKDASKAVDAKVDVPSVSFDTTDSRAKAEKQMKQARTNWHSFFTQRKKPKFSKDILNVIKGSGNQLRGIRNEVEGSKNKLVGMDNSVFGDENSLFGLNNNIFGSKNVVAKGN